MTIQLAFHETKFNVVNKNNQIWLSSKELAQALKYASTKAVTDVYNKNIDEFTDGMSQVVESMTSGNYRKKVRIFSLRGAHLIAMFARTPVAKEFRRWVLDILDRETSIAPTKAAPAITNVPFPKACRFIVTMPADGTADIKPIDDDTFVGKVEQILSGLRERGWIVARRETLAERLSIL